MYTKRGLFRLKCVLCGVLPVELKGSDEEPSESAKSIFSRTSGTGMDRLKRMYSVDEVGSFSPELIKVYQATMFSALIGASYGGLKNMKPTPEEIGRRDAVALKTKYHERYNSYPGGRDVASKFFKGALHWGWRVGLFCSSLALISSTVSVYRGESGVLEYTAAGALMGSVMGWRARGLKTMGMGGLVGIALGAVGGGAVYAAGALGGTTMGEVRFWRDGWKETQLKPTGGSAKRLREERRLLAERNELQEHTPAKTQGTSDVKDNIKES